MDSSLPGGKYSLCYATLLLGPIGMHVSLYIHVSPIGETCYFTKTLDKPNNFCYNIGERAYNGET